MRIVLGVATRADGADAAANTDDVDGVAPKASSCPLLPSEFVPAAQRSFAAAAARLAAERKSSFMVGEGGGRATRAPAELLLLAAAAALAAPM